MAQVIGCREIQSNYYVEQMTYAYGDTMKIIGNNLIMKTEGANMSINDSPFAPFDYNETTKIKTGATYKFDKAVVLTLWNEVII